jgi:hypothetical protein
MQANFLRAIPFIEGRSVAVNRGADAAVFGHGSLRIGLILGDGRPNPAQQARTGQDR